MNKLAHTNHAPLALVVCKDEPRIDSRLLATLLNKKSHQNFFELIKKYADKLNKLGKLLFQTGASKSSKTGQKEHFALLTDDQAYFVMTLSRNTTTVVDSKLRLIQSFKAARRALEMRQTEYLPTYHALHDRLDALADGSPNKSYIHMNINKLINKAVGIEPGTRPTAPLPQQALLVVAQTVAAQAIRHADDHHDGYERTKSAMLNLSRALLLEGITA